MTIRKNFLFDDEVAKHLEEIAKIEGKTQTQIAQEAIEERYKEIEIKKKLEALDRISGLFSGMIGDMDAKDARRVHVLKSMVNKVLLDTNIIVDIFDNTRTSSLDSTFVVKSLLENGSTLYVNSDTLTTTFYLLRNQMKMTFAEAIHAIKETSVFCELISIEKDDVMAAISLCEDKQTNFQDYEDVLQYVCAKKVDADLILTNDMGFVSLNIEVSNPKKFRMKK